MSLELLRALEQVVTAEIPSFELRFKNESALMKTLGFFMRPFNSMFMTRYTTTLGSTVYFPSKVGYEDDLDSSVLILAHEFVHMYDEREVGIRFKLGYASPQIFAAPVFVVHAIVGSPWAFGFFLAGYIGVAVVAMLFQARSRGAELGLKILAPLWVVLGLIALGSLAVALFTSGWWAFLFLSAMVLLLPWPSSARTHWELRGYAMNVAIYAWLRNARVADEVIQAIVRYFTGPDYWFMCQDSEKIGLRLESVMQQALTGQLQTVKPYSIVHGFLAEQQRLPVLRVE